MGSGGGAAAPAAGGAPATGGGGGDAAAEKEEEKEEGMHYSRIDTDRWLIASIIRERGVRRRHGLRPLRLKQSCRWRGSIGPVKESSSALLIPRELFQECMIPEGCDLAWAFLHCKMLLQLIRAHSNTDRNNSTPRAIPCHSTALTLEGGSLLYKRN